MVDDGGEQAWDEHLADLFDRYRPRILTRIEVLQAVADDPDPGPERIAAARTEAHKLHGLLGTIGLSAGSHLAAEIEARLDAGDAEIREQVADLRALVTEHA